MKSHSVTRDGVKHSFTFVQAERIKINEKSLRKALTARIYDKYTVKTLDRKKLEQAVESNEVDGMVVAQHLQIEKTTPHLRYTHKEVESDD